MHTILINIPRRQIIGGLLVAVLFAAMIALGLSHPSPADDSSASKKLSENRCSAHVIY